MTLQDMIKQACPINFNGFHVTFYPEEERMVQTLKQSKDVVYKPPIPQLFTVYFTH